MSKVGTSEPGLMSREVVRVEGDVVTIREVWNVKAPGCPMVCLDGSDVSTYGQEVIMSKLEAEARGLL